MTYSILKGFRETYDSIHSIKDINEFIKQHGERLKDVCIEMDDIENKGELWQITATGVGRAGRGKYCGTFPFEKDEVEEIWIEEDLSTSDSKKIRDLFYALGILKKYHKGMIKLTGNIQPDQEEVGIFRRRFGFENTVFEYD